MLANGAYLGPCTFPVARMQCPAWLVLQAEDLALEDSVLVLDRLLFTGQLPLDTYLKQVCEASVGMRRMWGMVWQLYGNRTEERTLSSLGKGFIESMVEPLFCS